MTAKPNFENRQDFLWIVQTAYLGNGINKASQEGTDNSRHQFSGLGIKNEMCDAVKASHLIPDEIDAVIAADNYVTWKLLLDGRPDQVDHMPRWITPGFAGWNK